MRCFVTGSGGHVGSFLTRTLLAHGEEVHLLLRSSSDLWRIRDVLDKCTVHTADLCDGALLGRILRDLRPEVVFHLAWEGISSADRNSPRQLTVNVPNTIRLLEAAAAAGCGCIVALGSQAEYGRYARAIGEGDPAAPETAYGVAKHALSLIAQRYCELTRVRLVWLRLFSTYGPMDHPAHLIPSLIEALLSRQVPPLTRGEQQWDYLYIEDAAEAIYCAARSKADGIYNLSSGRAAPLRAIVEGVRDCVDPALPLNFGSLSYRPDQVMHLQGSINKLTAATGWVPRTPLELGLEQTVAWHRAQR